ncbi:hypothetical protein [Actinocorallia lasiicapitis]
MSDPRVGSLSPDLANNSSQDSIARVFGAVSGIGLLLSAVMPWASLGIGSGLIPSDIGINQLFAGFGHEKGWFSMAFPLLFAGFCNLLAALFRPKRPGAGMFGRFSSGGTPVSRKVLLTLGTLVAIVTTVLWVIQTGQFRINDGFDFLPGNVEYGAWLGLASTAAALLATVMAHAGAAKSIKVPKTETSTPHPPSSHT